MICNCPVVWAMFQNYRRSNYYRRNIVEVNFSHMKKYSIRIEFSSEEPYHLGKREKRLIH